MDAGEFRQAPHGLSISGEVDLANADALRAAIRMAVEGGDGAVIIDAPGLRFIDSSGITVLVREHEALAKAGRVLRVENLSSPVKHGFARTGVLDLLT